MSTEAVDSKQIIPENVYEAVEEYLQRYPSGFKEYDLIEYLNEKNIFQEKGERKSASLQLFQKHFLLFHILYNISEKMILGKSGYLKISPLLIQKIDYSEAGTELSQFDPLREYYMDLSNMKEATEDTVDKLLSAFWTQYLRNDKRQEALSTLGLIDPVDEQQIRSTYRRLMSTHHPDKGGDNEKVQVINKAYAILVKT